MAAISLLIAVLFLVCVVAFLVDQVRRPHRFPPGPRWLPLMGNVRELRALCRKLGSQQLALTELARRYQTDVLGLRLGNEPIVVASSYRTVHTVLTSSEYEGRPDSFFIRLRCMGKRRGITCLDGPLWVEQRQFVLRHLRNLGFGKKPMESMVQDELTEILNICEAQKQEVQLCPVFAPSVLSVMWALVTGTRLLHDDVRLTRFLDLLHTRSKAFDMAGGTMSQFPWLRYIMPEKIGYNLILRLNAELKEFCMETINEHHRTWTPDRQDDLIYSFITEMNRSEEAKKTFTDDQMLMICLDIIIAGSHSTSNTLDFVCLAMLLYPEIQEKAANCLNSALGPDDKLTYADRLKMPYIEAVILEAERFFDTVPVSGPRRVLKDTVLEGYNIPKETTVLLNIHSVHHDLEYWGDPHVFRPERFLDEEGRIVYNERVINFGLGKRRCLGELLARQCIFLFFAGILRNYRICQVPGTKLPSPVPVPGLTQSTAKYTVQLQPRINS